MRLSLRATAMAAGVFAAICFGVAIEGFISLGDISDPTQLSDAKGFAWFWTFLGSIAVVCGLFSWRMASKSEDED
jgi:hypothetical protein